MAITTLENVKIYLGITDTESDDLIEFLIELVEDDYLRIRNKPFDTDEDTIVYPEGSELVAIRMIGYHLQERGRSGDEQSKSMGPVSVTYRDSDFDYPKKLIGGIKRFNLAEFK